MNKTIQKCRAVAVGLGFMIASGLAGSAFDQAAKSADTPKVRSRADPCLAFGK